MTCKESIDYINNMEVSNILKQDLLKYNKRLFDEYFETYDLIREGHYYNVKIHLVRECYIEYSAYLYALCRANVISKIDFYTLENAAYKLYEILQMKEY